MESFESGPISYRITKKDMINTRFESKREAVHDIYATKALFPQQIVMPSGAKLDPSELQADKFTSMTHAARIAKLKSYIPLLINSLEKIPNDYVEEVRKSGGVVKVQTRIFITPVIQKLKEIDRDLSSPSLLSGDRNQATWRDKFNAFWANPYAKIVTIGLAISLACS